MSEMGKGGRVWAAGKTAAASALGPAGLAVSSSLLCAAVLASGLAAAPQGASMMEALGAMPLGHGAAMGAGAALALGGLAASAYAGAAGFVKSLAGKVGADAMGPKEALSKAWAAARGHLLYGGLSTGLLYGASMAATSGDGGAISGGALAAVVGLGLTGAVGLVVSAVDAVSKGLDAAKAARAGSGGQSQHPAEAAKQESGPEAAGVMGAAKTLISGALEGGSKLASWREAKAASQAARAPAPSAPAGPSM